MTALTALSSHDLLFSNWLLMYLAGNYCYWINALAPPALYCLSTLRQMDNILDNITRAVAILWYK